MAIRIAGVIALLWHSHLENQVKNKHSVSYIFQYAIAPVNYLRLSNPVRIFFSDRCNATLLVKFTTSSFITNSTGDKDLQRILTNKQKSENFM